jgi:hypothetical protein
MTLPELMKAVLEREREQGFAGQKGLHLTGNIPITQDIANEFIKNMPSKDERVKDPILVIMDNNRFALSIQVEVAIFKKRIDLLFSFDPVVNFPDDPIFRLHLDAGNIPDFILDIVMGSIAKMSSRVKIEGRDILLDLGAPLKEKGMGDILPFIRKMEITSEKRKMHLKFEFKVD